MNKTTKVTGGRSLLLGSAMARLALTCLPLAMLWMAVAWALSLP